MSLRMYHLDHQSLWVDEIASMNGADPDQSWSAVIKYSVSDQPPAFFLLLHGWFKVFPFTDFFGRLLGLAIGIIGILTIFFLGKEVKDRRTGIVAALITALSYIHILFSQEVRFYTLVFLFSTLSYLYFIRAVKTAKMRAFVLYSLSTGALLYTHYFGLVVFASQGLLFCLLTIFYPAERRFIILSIASALLVIVLISPWIPIFFSDAKTEDFWIQPEPFYFLIRYFYVYFKDVLSCLVFGALIIVYFFDLYKQFKSHRSVDRVDAILIGGVSFGFLVPIIYSIVQTPLLHVRYFMVVLPCIIVMISLGLSLLKASFQRIILITTCCTSLFSLIVIEQYYTKPQKEDWRGMIREISKRGAMTDAYVSEYAWYCNYYFKQFHSEIRTVLPVQFDVEKQKPPGVWWLQGFSVNALPDQGEVDLMKKGYVLMRTDSLYRVEASYYKLP